MRLNELTGQQKNLEFDCLCNGQLEGTILSFLIQIMKLLILVLFINSFPDEENKYYYNTLKLIVNSCLVLMWNYADMKNHSYVVDLSLVGHWKCKFVRVSEIVFSNKQSELV